MRICMSIAGSDSSAGAGIQADLKTFAAHGVYGVTAVTAVTVQNTVGVEAVQEMEPNIVSGQIRCLFEDMPVHAVKIGMVFNSPIIEAIAGELTDRQALIVLDPVMISKSGFELLRREAQTALQRTLFPMADLITPNVHEAELLTGQSIRDLSDMEQAARSLLDTGAGAVVVKGGHLEDHPGTDVYCDPQGLRHLSAEYVATSSTHGTGCTFSSALTAHRAMGRGPFQAALLAKEYMSAALAASRPIGRGNGPVNHFPAAWTRGSG
jgi:hydroxymethylpyrimidine/phosphomethylpyrimidine kinase